MDGLEATRRIRSLGGARGRVPIIGLTAQAFSEQVRACTEAGMDGHLPKPYTPQALLEIVAKTASRQASTGAVLGSVPTAQDGPGMADRPVDDDVRRPNQPLLRARELSGTAAAGERHQAIAYE
jgi:DNA-binding response OmpR family regulator